MAASVKVGGYQCKFIVEVPDDLLCKSCRHVARQPHLTSCCGAHYCHTCIAAILQDNKPCPSCKEDTFTIFMNRREHQKILALPVCCRMKDSGCQWTGRLEQLETHLDANTGDCQYLNIECPEKCGHKVQKHHLATHIANECPKRDFTCMYCDFKSTYEVVSEKHWPECQNYPVPCPNRCQIGSVERNTLEDHLNMCRLGIVECDFSYAGCNEKLQRQDMEKHVEENTQKHLALMAAASIKTNQEFRQELQVQRDKFQGDLEQKDRQIKVAEEHLQQSVREKENQIESMQKSFQKEQQKMQQQLEEKERHMKHVQESLQEQLQEKQQQIEALKAQTIQVKQDHEEKIEAVKERLQQTVREREEQIENVRETLQKEHEKQIKALKVQIVQVKQDHEEQIKAVKQQREEQIKSLEVQSQQQIGNLEKQLKETERELELQLNIKLGVPPFHLTMYNFNLWKTRNIHWLSPAMYTHPRGYKFCILVKPYGNYSMGSWWRGEVYHVSVSFLPMSGKFDATLQWPAKFTITLQLLNQHRDRNHITVTKQFEWTETNGSQYFTEELLAHNNLESNAQKQAQYLKYDCLRFCISKIEEQM